MIAKQSMQSAGVLLALALMAGGFGGCCGSKEQQLKDDNIALQARLRLTEAEKDDLDRQKSALEGENARLKADLAAAQQKPAAQPMPQPTGAMPNFGEGVEVSETATSVTVSLPETILFDSGKAVLKAGSKTTLDKVAGVLKKDYSGRMICVEGYTDSDPIKKSGWTDNKELSCQRALAVERYLISKGVDKDKVYVAGYGELLPRAGNDTAAGKARNRRVQIVIPK